MICGFKTEKRNHFSQFGQVLTRLSWQPLLLIKLQTSPLGSTTPESRRQQLPVMRAPGKQFEAPKSSSRSSSKDNGPHPWRTLSPTPATLQQPAGQCTVEAWGSYYQNINGFSSSTLASIPDCSYFCALRYRTSFSHAPGLGFGSEAAVNCYLTVVGSLILIRSLLWSILPTN